MKLSVLIPAHNEEGSIRETVEELYTILTEAHIPPEILVVNDHSKDRTVDVLETLAQEMPSLRWVYNFKSNGFGNAIHTGLEQFTGDVVCIVMADASDDPVDVVTYYRRKNNGNSRRICANRTKQSKCA